MATLQVLLFVIVLPLAAGFDSEVISDIVSPAADEGRAIDMKAQQFWETIQDSSHSTTSLEHSEVYAEVEAALAALPAENTQVRAMMKEALMRLQRADKMVLQQSEDSADLATEHLATKPVSESLFSFMTGGQNFLALAIRRFVGGADYADRVAAEVSNRQGNVLPALRGAAAITGNVYDDCRMVSKLGFDVLKYDIYNEGVPQTPAFVKTAADKLVDASAQTRHQFMQGVIGFARALTIDTEEKDINPSAKVTQTLLSDMHSKWDLDESAPLSHEGPLIIE